MTEGAQAPASIVIEGPIGAGKTTLAKKLAQHLRMQPVLEESRDNPFLPHFYEAPDRYALPAQLYFLFQRDRQIGRLRQIGLFQPPHWVADFMMDKDPLFAKETLEEQEYRLYLQVYDLLGPRSAPVPELTIYLQAPPEVLLRRIARRGISYERRIDAEYLQRICGAYVEYFHYYESSPLLIVNVSECNLADSEQDFQALLRHLRNCRAGRHYLNPGGESRPWPE